MFQLAKLLRDQRRVKGLSQVELAQKANVSLATLQNIEADRANPSLETLKLICNELDLEIKIQPQIFSSIETLIHLGCPLMSENSLPQEIPSRQYLISTLRTLDPEALCQSDRERSAVHAWLTAIESHYPTLWESSSPMAKSWMLKFSTVALKQRRLALAKLGEYL